ncbi:ABC transporter substrate-binding protein [Pseudoalteromonas sp. SCSIO 43101]|uniref:ABC transporter substrate-binding protein n=1 Tax=Pseudoalteromonas sp. SCSIO 43101 TaxID=2822847 RepID=UPI00202B6878|nr:ABC transporter substrate-binding protein [Pseudoalteromonas sp. SCSIO 43101]URQ91158.1 ABC transporter substrate-binding protein [Pseudoalteromonas sp. SCSIO 43101]
MSKYIKQVLCVVAGAFFAPKTDASEQLTITWFENDAKPFFIEKSKANPHGGLCNEITDMLIEALPEINHSKVILPQKRGSKYLADGKMACYACMIHRGKKNNHVTYSIPTTVYPPFSVLSTEEKSLKIKQKHGDPVPLISLFTDANFIYGQNSARKFGSKLDKIAKNTKLYESAALSGNGSSPNFVLLSQLEHGYIDYTIDYPFVADYYNQQNLQNIQKLTIVNPAQSIVFGAIGCSTNAPNHYAEKVLVQINEALKNKVLPSERYQQSQRTWLEQSFPEFSTYYQRYILDPLTEPATDEIITPVDHP